MYINLSDAEPLNILISSLSKQIQSLPNGKVIAVKDRCYTKWFFKDRNSYTYLSKKNESDMELVKDLVYKKYLQNILIETQTELNAINAYMAKHDSGEKKSEQMIAADSPYRPLLTELLNELPPDAKAWAHEHYETNTSYPEGLKFKVTSGLLVRSKSEALIAESLLAARIPFRYECALELDEHTYYPDFTIMHPKTKQIFYWEHLGLMSSPEYIQKNYRKLTNYAIHGISPLTTLILTYEDLEHPLTQAKVYEVISQYFSHAK